MCDNINHHCLPKGFNHRNWGKTHDFNGGKGSPGYPIPFAPPPKKTKKPKERSISINSCTGKLVFKTNLSGMSIPWRKDVGKTNQRKNDVNKSMGNLTA